MSINKTLNTRLCLKYDTYDNWVANGGTDYTKTPPSNGVYDGFIPLKGEVCVVSTAKDGATPSSSDDVLLKVGDGKLNFASLPWVSAKAADVNEWAKKSAVSISEHTVKDQFKITVGDKEEDKEVYINKYSICFHNGYDDKTDTYKEPIEVSLDGLYDLTRLAPEIKVTLGSGDIIDAINKVYAAVQVGGTGSLVTVRDDDEEATFKRTIVQGSTEAGEITLNIGSGLAYNTTNNTIYHDETRPENKVTLTPTKDTSKSYITGIDVDEFGHIIGAKYNDVHTEDTDTKYDLGLDTSAASVHPTLVLKGSDNTEDKVVFTNRDTKIKLSQEKETNTIIINHSTVTVDTDDNDGVTLEHENTFKVFTDISVDGTGHVTKAKMTEFTLPGLPEDEDTTYDLTTKENEEKGIVTLVSSDTTEDDVAFVGIGGTSVSSNGAGIVTIDSEVIRAEGVDENPVIVEEIEKQGVDHAYKIYHESIADNTPDKDLTSTSLSHADTIEVVTDVEYDTYGHVSGATYKKYTLPTLSVREEDPLTITDEDKFVWKIEENPSDGEILYHTEPFVEDIPSNLSAKRAPQTKAVVDYVASIKNALEGAIGAATNGAVVIKGTIAAREEDGATIHGRLPEASKATLGHAYKVISSEVQLPPYSDTSGGAKVGDMFICYEVTAPTNSAGDNGVYDWLYVPSGDDIEDTWRDIKVDGTTIQNIATSTGALDLNSGDKITLSVSNKKITFNHDKVALTEKTETLDEITNDDTFSTDIVTVDEYGHVTSHISKEYKLKEAPAFAEVKSSDNGATSESALTSKAATFKADSIDDAIEFTTGNKWVDISLDKPSDHPVLTIAHSVSGVNAGSAGSTSGKTFKIPEITVDTAGHVTSLSEGSELTIPDVPEVPTHLPNPESLVFKDAIKYDDTENYELDVPYDGSKQLNIKAFNSSIYLHRDASSVENVKNISIESAEYSLVPVQDITRTIDDTTIAGASFGLERNMTGESRIETVQVIGESDVVTVKSISGDSSPYNSDKGAVQVTIADKGIKTEKIDDHAVGAQQVKAEKGYTGDDAEVWVFYCGSASTLTNNDNINLG